MSLPELKRIVTRLTHGKLQGTAFLVGKKHALTCAHCLGEDERDPVLRGPISLHFNWWNDKRQEYIASIEQIDWDLDIALLKLDEEAPVDPLPLATSAEIDKSWTAFGYPEPVGHDGFPLKGVVSDPDARAYGRPALLLKCDEGADKINGASGSPVMVDDQIVGILTNQLLRYNASGQKVPVFAAAYACPLGAIPGQFFPDAMPEEVHTSLAGYIDPESVFRRLDLELFAGRQWLIDQLDSFLQNPKKRGYFVLEAEAGLGKTAVLAWLVRERGYVHHFSELEPGPDGIERTLRNLAVQIARVYDLNIPKTTLSSSETSGKNLFVRLLEEAAGKRNRNENIVLVIDALDEAETPYHQNVLGLPKVLPEGVFIIASKRPVAVTLEVDTALTPRRIVPLAASDENNRRDMELFLQQVVKWPEIAERLGDREFWTRHFVDALLAKSGGMWMYLHFIIHEMKAGDRQPLHLDGLPNGLFQYYAQHWRRWREKNQTQWYSLHLPLLAALAAAQESVTAELLLEWTKLRAELEPVQQLLNGDWCPFIIVASRRPTSKYRFSHATLREFFSGKVKMEELEAGEREFVNELAARTAVANNDIADFYTSRLHGVYHALSGLEDLTRPDETDSYGIRHLVSHLEIAGRVQEIHRLLSVSRQRIEYVPAAGSGLYGFLARLFGVRSKVMHEHLVWHRIRTQWGDLGGYLADIERAWRLAEAAGQKPDLSGPESAIALQCRYALLTASLRTLSTNIPSNILAGLVQEDIWRPNQALAYAIAQPDEGHRNRMLMDIVPVLASAGQPDEALAAAIRISHGGMQSQSLAKVAPHAPPALWPRLLDQAELLMTIPPHELTGMREETDKDIRSFYRARLRANILASLIAHVPQSLLHKACEVARKVAPALDRVFALAILLPHLRPDGRMTVLAEAREQLKLIPNEVEQALAFTKLGPYLSEAERREVVHTGLLAAQKAKNDYDKEELLADLINLMPAALSPQAAVEQLRSLTSEDVRLSALIAIASQLPTPQLGNQRK
jgi:Trypsin-like peptidase domain